mgnify:CR=1 FL=1
MKHTIIVLSSILGLIGLSYCKEPDLPKSKLPCDTKFCDQYRLVVKPSAVARQAPSVDSPVEMEIAFGSFVSLIDKEGPKATLLGLEGQWWKIQYEGKVAWIFSRLLVPTGYSFDGFRVHNGEAIFTLPSTRDQISPAGRTLSLQYWEHHYSEHCVYFFSEDFSSAKVDCCSAGSGPPLDNPANRPVCKERNIAISGNKEEFRIEGVVYQWEPRLGGYVPQDGTAWGEVIQQAFYAKPSSEGFDRNYRHVPDGCTFCVDDSCLEPSVSYLCDLGEKENPMRERQKEFDRIFGKPKGI